MRQVGFLLSAVTWLLVAGSIVVLTGGLFGRPLLLAAVPTGSMVPVLRPGDLIVVLPTWVTHSAGLGDIVVFKTPQDRTWIVHRIVDGNVAEGFVTRGDANPSADAVRVFPRDMVGLVPQWNGNALRLPRLGVLSIAGGPLSSPIVAGVALVMGVYLLVLDVRPGFRMPRFPKRSSRAKPVAILQLYMGLAGTAFVTTLIPAWSLSSTQAIRYEVIEQKQVGVNVRYQYLQGRDHTEEVWVTNPSPLPLVLFYQPEDPNVIYAPRWLIVGPRGKASFRVTVLTPELGTFESRVQNGVFMPVLPPVVIAALASVSLPLAGMVTAAVPALLIFALALLDARSRASLSRWWAGITARYAL